MEQYADLAIKSSCIFTSNTLEPISGMVLVSGKKIIGVFSDDSDADMQNAQSQIGPDTKVIDAGNRTVLPGFNDAHTHFIQNGVLKDASYTLDLEGVTSKEEACQKIKDFAAEHPKNAWISGCGLNWDAWDTEPSLELLDELVPDRPSYFASWDMHTGWMNSLALEAAGYTKDTPDPDGGYIGHKDDGSLSGLCYEPPANDPVWGLANMAADMDHALGSVISEALSYGVTATGCVWPYGGIPEDDNIRILREFDEAGKLPIRVSCFVKLEKGLANAHKYKAELTGDHVLLSGTKLITDGVCEAHTGYLTEPYADDPSTCGEPTVPHDELLPLIMEANANGFSVRLHCIGNGAVKQALDCFEETCKKQGYKGIHNAIEHIESCRPEDIDRFVKLGVQPSMQPIHSVLNVEGYPQILGEKWVPYMWPVKSLIDSGAIMAFGTDAPVWNLNPMEGIYAAITRQQPWDAQPEGGFVPSQKITLAQALQAYTYGSARVENLERKIGTLEAGKFADIVIMNANLFELTPAEILKAKPTHTFVDGEVVFEA